MPHDILIQGGHLFDPSQNLDVELDLAIQDDKILAIGDIPKNFKPQTTLHAQGQTITPGFIDLCHHLREPGKTYKGTITSETKAAAAAGFTHLLCPPDTLPIIDTPAVVQLIQDRAQQFGFCNILTLGALTKQLDGHNLSELSALKNAGCYGVSNCHFPMANQRTFLHCIEYAATHQLCVHFRPQDFHLSSGHIHDGVVATETGLEGIPSCAETIAIAQQLILLEATGAAGHFSRLSCRQSVALIEQAQQKGLPVTCDVSLPQLLFTEQNTKHFNALFHLKPPLRTEQDRKALLTAINQGVIQGICSDHQPHEPEAKLAPFAATEPGMATLDIFLPALLQLVQNNELELKQVIHCLTSGPAQVLNLPMPSLKVGNEANITLFDPNTEWILDANTQFSQGANTPLSGELLRGKVTHTFLAGKHISATIPDTN